MKPSRVRLAVCALLFVGWVGWLVYLSATTTRPVVLSRPQFLASSLYVVAELHAGPKGNAPDEKATLREVVWSDSGEEPRKELVIPNLPRCGPAQGWVGPGEYILPLTKVGPTSGDAYRLTDIPRSPGFGGGVLRIYPANPTARRELKDLVAEFHPK